MIFRILMLIVLPVLLFAKNEVTIKEEGQYRYIESKGIPAHKTGQFPNRGNPNRISEQHYYFRIPLHPHENSYATPVGRMLFGVAINGVPFDPGTAEFWNHNPRSGWNYEALTGHTDLGLDNNNAHVQPTGAYHYHGLPVGLVQRMRGWEKTPALIGYAADGFPIYALYGYVNSDNPKRGVKKMKSSYRLKKGTATKNLYEYRHASQAVLLTVRMTESHRQLSRNVLSHRPDLADLWIGVLPPESALQALLEVS